MGEVLALRTSAAMRALAQFREEERAFEIVLEVLKEWRSEKLFLPLFALYRARMRHLRRIAGALLEGIEQASAADELRRFARERNPL